MLSSSQKIFEITDYGIYNLKDAVEELRKNIALISVESLTNSDDVLLSLPKKRASNAELRKTSVFAAATIELLKSAPQYMIAYEKFSCSYHYHFTYQLRFNDYGHGKLADMMECLQGIVKIETFNDEDRKIYLCPKVAQRIFSEQLRDVTEVLIGKSFSFISVAIVLGQHKKKFGYQIRPEMLGYSDIWSGTKSLPFIELIIQNDEEYIICHHDDNNYKFKSHSVMLLLHSMTTNLLGKKYIPMSQLIQACSEKFGQAVNDSFIESMNHLIDIKIENNMQVVSLSKLAVFLLSIVNTLKLAPSITVSELKANINTKINLTNACFEIGYPDLKTIIESFDDMFVIRSPSSTNELTERSEITFNMDSVFAGDKHPILDHHNESFPVQNKRSLQPTKMKSNSMSISRNDNQNGKSTGNSIPFIPFGEIERNSNSQPCVVRSNYTEMPMKFMRTNNHEMIPNNTAAKVAQKENVPSYFGITEVQPNTSESNVPPRKKYSLKRSHGDHLNEIHDIINNKRSTLSLLSRYLDKPDSPASNPLPFWLDPIWQSSPPAAVTNEPSRALPSNSSPFKRWGQSSFRSRSNETRTPVQRRPSSLAASESDVYSKSIDDDADSLRSRSDLTKKEFSAENIYFWTSCERYCQLEDAERSREAIQIFTKHLGVGAPEPVNVDSQARTTAQKHLQKAEKDLFTQAQKQIFSLMKFDSYQRFIRSDLYKSCLDAEVKKLPIPYPGDQLDACLRTHLVSPLATKLKKSLSNAEDRRRKSLLPWHRKVRCKSKDRGEELRKEAQAIGASGTLLKVTHSGSDLHSSRSSLSSFDAAISCRTNNQNECDDSKSSLCRVILSDGATTIVQTKPSESIRELVERLLQKRGISYQAYEGFLAGNSKPLDLEGPSVSLAGKEMLIEQRVVFKLDLSNRKVISVKSKPCKALGELLRPILHKYSYRLDLVQVSSKEYPEPIDMTLPVTVCDGQRLQIACKTGDYPVEIQPITTSQSPKLHKKVNPPPSTHYSNLSMHPPSSSTFHNHHVPKSFKPNSQQSHLDEITNKVFNELLQEKVDAHSQHNPSNMRPPVSDHGSTRSDDFGSETSSGIFGRLKRRDSNFPVSRLNKAKKIVAPSSTTGSDDGATTDGVKKPLIAKWKAGVKLQVTGRTDNHDFLEGLKRAQRFRLEDQRGTEINCELPDFLKDKENFVNHKLRKCKPSEPVPVPCTTSETTTVPLVRPQPAPRYSITKSPSATSIQNGDNSSTISLTNKRLSPTMENIQNNDANSSSYLNSSFTSQISQSGSTIDEYFYDSNTDPTHPRGPPPLPPKPKILPIKPPNWGQSPSKSDRSPQDEMASGLVKPRNVLCETFLVSLCAIVCPLKQFRIGQS